MKVVVDSSVIIAAYAARGFCFEIFELCLYEHEVVLCDEIVREVRKGLLEKIKVSDKIVREIILSLKKDSSIVEPEIVPKKYCRDENDLMILGTAKTTNADVILTVDKDLLVVKQFGPTKIFSPRGMWNYLKSNR